MKYLFLALFTALTICSCGDIVKREGDWEPMEWEKTNYRKTRENFVTCYTVPSEGGTYTFHCKNYSWILITQLWFEQDGNRWCPADENVGNPDYVRDVYHYSNDWIEVTAPERQATFTVVFQANNTGSMRKVEININPHCSKPCAQPLKDVDKIAL